MFNTTLSAFILNTLTLSNTSLTSIISLIILIILLLDRSFTEDIHLLLCMNTYLVIFAFSVTSSSLYIDTLRGDLGSSIDGKRNQTLCNLRGMLVLAFFSSIFGAFCLHGFYRLCRIVYPQYVILQRYSFQIILILGQWLSSLLFAGVVEIRYLPGEYYCSIPFDSLIPILSASLLSYGIPSLMLALIYIRIVLYIRSHGQLVKSQRGHRRDMLVIRRTAIIVIILWLLGIPSMILVFYGQINGGQLHPLTYRIEWITPSLALLLLNFVLIKSDPKLRKIIEKKYRTESSQCEAMLPSTT